MSTRDQTIWEILDTETREHWARAGGTRQASHSRGTIGTTATAAYSNTKQ